MPARRPHGASPEARERDLAEGELDFMPRERGSLRVRASPREAILRRQSSSGDPASSAVAAFASPGSSACLMPMACTLLTDAHIRTLFVLSALPVLLASGSGSGIGGRSHRALPARFGCLPVPRASAAVPLRPPARHHDQRDAILECLLAKAPHDRHLEAKQRRRVGQVK